MVVRKSKGKKKGLTRKVDDIELAGRLIITQLIRKAHDLLGIGLCIC